MPPSLRFRIRMLVPRCCCRCPWAWFRFIDDDDSGTALRFHTACASLNFFLLRRAAVKRTDERRGERNETKRCEGTSPSMILPSLHDRAIVCVWVRLSGLVMFTLCAPCPFRCLSELMAVHFQAHGLPRIPSCSPCLTSSYRPWIRNRNYYKKGFRHPTVCPQCCRHPTL